MAERKKRTFKAWFGINDDGYPIPFTGAYLRRDCRRNIKEWLDEDDPWADQIPIRRATLTLSKPKRKK